MVVGNEGCLPAVMDMVEMSFPGSFPSRKDDHLGLQAQLGPLGI